MWEVWIKIEFRHEALWSGKSAMSNLHDVNYGRQPILLPWQFPGCQVPGLTSHTSGSPLPVNPSPTDLHTSTSKESPPILNSPPIYTNSTVSHPQFPSFCKNQVMAPAHNLVSLLLHCFYTLISWQKGIICLDSPGNQARASAVAVRRHDHHATN